jgi:hypothetical protein
VLRPPLILPLIEPDIDIRDMYAYYLHTFGFMVQAADTTDDETRERSRCHRDQDSRARFT